MKRLAALFGGAALLALVAGPSFAQSSGNFSASFGSTECAIDDASGVLSGGIQSLPPVTVKVSSGSGVALVITPSLVTGLFTQNTITSKNSVSTQNVGIEVQVAVDGSTADVVPELGSDGVLYDQRFIQVSSSVISSLAGCSSLSGGSCFQLTESTLSAHSFNFYIFGLSSGTHTVTVSWTIEGGTSGEAECVGPGTLTVTQVKNFSFDTPLSF
jgi:hypothetical protein